MDHTKLAPEQVRDLSEFMIETSARLDAIESVVSRFWPTEYRHAVETLKAARAAGGNAPDKT